MILDATALAHALVGSRVAPGDTVVDATVGNGHDTAFLAGLVGPTGRVFGFDIQPAALAATAARLGTPANVTLIEAGHEQLGTHLPADVIGRVAAVMFNLGYLPGGDKRIITRSETTLAALEAALAIIAPGSLVTAVVYPGHPGGREEADAVRAFASRLDCNVATLATSRLDLSAAAPSLIAFERRA